MAFVFPPYCRSAHAQPPPFLLCCSHPYRPSSSAGACARSLLSKSPFAHSHIVPVSLPCINKENTTIKTKPERKSQHCVHWFGYNWRLVGYSWRYISVSLVSRARESTHSVSLFRSSSGGWLFGLVDAREACVPNIRHGARLAAKTRCVAAR